MLAIPAWSMHLGTTPCCLEVIGNPLCHGALPDGEARQWGVSQCIIIACLQKLSMKLAVRKEVTTCQDRT
jgi:hypothetical protein